MKQIGRLKSLETFISVLTWMMTDDGWREYQRGQRTGI